jgi:large subunit ribosomal protein L3
MVQGIIGKKLGMTQVYKENGEIEGVTAIEAGPCAITQVKTDKNDGYKSVQLGFGAAKKIKKAVKGQMHGTGEFRYLREFRVDDTEAVKPGDKVDVSQFKAGEFVDVTGVSKSKGFAGVVKRHHFKGGPKTHGQTDRNRRPGAIGSTTSPGRVLKGVRMAGRMGGDRVTARRLEVFKTDPEKNLLVVKGPVPGTRNGLVLIKKANKGK